MFWSWMSGKFIQFIFPFLLMFSVSASMLPNPQEPEKGDRGKAMIEAGKRWVKYEIPDSVRLGMAMLAQIRPH